MHPLPGVRITLVTRDLHTPYSGMLPGFIAVHYSYDDAHIDLLPLARYAGARVIHAEVYAIDAEHNQISINGRPALDYDLLSINIGSRPFMPHAEDSVKNQFAVKPVDRFINSWHQLEQGLRDNDSDLRLAIIGGGDGGVELALSLDYRARQPSQARTRPRLVIVTDRDRLLPGHNARVQQRFAEILKQRSIPVYYEHPVSNLLSPVVAVGRYRENGAGG
jgi:selenide,water dikinase